MAFLIRRAVRFAAQKLASDPRARQKAGEVAKVVADEVKTIAREEDRAYAAGRSVRRLLNQWQHEGKRGQDRDDDPIV